MIVRCFFEFKATNVISTLLIIEIKNKTFTCLAQTNEFPDRELRWDTKTGNQDREINREHRQGTKNWEPRRENKTENQDGAQRQGTKSGKQDGDPR